MDLFDDRGYEFNADTLIQSEAYDELRRDKDDAVACGLYGVAAAAVAVPFVGCTVAAIAVTQILRSALRMDLAPLLSGDVLSQEIFAA